MKYIIYVLISTISLSAFCQEIKYNQEMECFTKHISRIKRSTGEIMDEAFPKNQLPVFIALGKNNIKAYYKQKLQSGSKPSFDELKFISNKIKEDRGRKFNVYQYETEKENSLETIQVFNEPGNESTGITMVSIYQTPHSSLSLRTIFSCKLP